jgi:hypothetical protein
MSKDSQANVLMNARFTMDPLGGQAFDGYSMGDLWNGWARPLFDFEVSQQIVEACRQQGQEAHYDAARDMFVFGDGQNGGAEEFEAVEVAGRKLYPVGSGAWIWEEVDGE